MLSKGWNSKPKQTFTVSSNRRDINTDTVSLLSLLPVGKWTDSGLFLTHNVYLELNKRSVIGDIFFSTKACLVYWSKTCLDSNLNSCGSFNDWFWTWCHLLDPKHGSFGLDVVDNSNIHFLVVYLSGSLCLFFSCKAMKLNNFWSFYS